MWTRPFRASKTFPSTGLAELKGGKPAESLLYHAFASPNVTFVPGANSTIPGWARRLQIFQRWLSSMFWRIIFCQSWSDLSYYSQNGRALAGASSGDVELAIGVFACEYRSSSETPSTLCRYVLFPNRVARVGNHA